jgi:phosphopantetheinyl transferase (holo-ACP synthase)
MSHTIGIDLVDLNRFVNSRHRDKFVSRFCTADAAPLTIAKTWACLEAIIKAEHDAFDPTLLIIQFPKNSSPIVQDPKKVLKYQYQLSISHEKSLVVAVALGTLKVD